MVETASADAVCSSLQTAFYRRPSKGLFHPCVGATDVKTELNEYGFGMFGGNVFQQAERVEQSPCDNRNDAQQMEIYRDLILRHLIQDIGTTCAKLALPTDPYNWTVEHGARWISEMCQQFSLTAPAQMYLSGQALLRMNQKDFELLAPEGGDTLYAQLQLWKTGTQAVRVIVGVSCQAAGDYNTCIECVKRLKGLVHCHIRNVDVPFQLVPSTDKSTSTISAFESCTPQQQYGQGGIITAADNSTQKPNWNNNPLATDIKDRTQFASSFNSTPTPDNSQMFYNTGYNGTTVENASLFNSSDVVLSPSNSEMSSNASMPDVNDDDCGEWQRSMLQMQRPNFPVGINQPNSAIGMAVGDDERPPTYGRHSGTIHLWHFIRELLDQPKQYGSCVRWVDRDEGTFKIESSHHLARFWGQRKNRSQMNYDKLSRSLRQYYKKGIIQKPEKKQRLVYKFLPPYNL